MGVFYILNIVCILLNVYSIKMNKIPQLYEKVMFF